MNGNMSAADVMALTRDGGNFLEGNGILIILFFLVFFGGFGGLGQGGNYQVPATKDYVSDRFNNQNVINSLNGISKDITTGTYEMKSAVSGAEMSLQKCCCETQRAIDNVNFNLSKGVCDIVNEGHNDTQRIIDTINHYAMEQKDNKITEQGQLLSEARIVAAMKPQAPIPAYPVPSPYGQYGWNNGCGNLYA